MSLAEDIQSYHAAGQRGYWINTFEEARVLAELRAVAKEVKRGTRIYTYSQASGCWGPEGNVTPAAKPISEVFRYLEALTDPAPIWLILLDIHENMKMPFNRIIREMLDTPVKDLADQERRKLDAIIFVSPKDAIPLELSHSVVPLRFSLPNQERLEEVISHDDRVTNLSGAAVQVLAESAVGLTENEALINIRRAAILFGKKKSGTMLKDMAECVWKSKAEGYRTRGLVGILSPKMTMDDIGGMRAFKRWFTSRLQCFSPEARRLNVPMPKGVILSGGVGCGKSAIAQAIANLLQRRYLELDLGKLMNPYVGNTEQNTRDLLELIDLHSPCVVRIDEIAHQMSGHESSGFTDSGVVSRMIQSFLTWMEERTSDAFLIGTTNEPWRVPAPMLRAGRFDGMWWVPLPAEDDLQDIVMIHLRKYLPDVADKLDIRDLCADMANNQFSGAEAEQTIIEALQTTFPQMPTIKELMQARDRIIPAAKMMDKHYQQMTEWAKSGKARNANVEV